MATKKKAPAKKAPAEKAPGKNFPAVKAPAKKNGPAVKKAPDEKNKLGVKNSLVNNINAKKKSGKSKPKSESTISKKAYRDMQNNWGREK
ncbi:hypothetical protein [Pollutibacter soli]|uniref:hypothetical protein n=1 Tax=Pollutibacter soli TaxID=3034157 RepID=UPI003013FA14